MAVALWYLALTQGAGVPWTQYVFQRMLVAICTSCERKAACLAVSSLRGLRVVVLCSSEVGWERQGVRDGRCQLTTVLKCSRE